MHALVATWFGFQDNLGGLNRDIVALTILQIELYEIC